MPRLPGRVITVPPAAPFLPALARGVLDGTFWSDVGRDDPLSLARATLYVPGRRAARALRRAFLDAAGHATLLPRLVAIADLEEADQAGPDDETIRVLGGADAVSESLCGLARQLAMMRLMEDWPRPDSPKRHDEEDVILPCSPADAAHLAGDLIRLMDEVARERADWSLLDGVLDHGLTRYWGVSRDFLKVASEAWPAHLERMRAVDAGAERDAALKAEAERLREGRGPVLGVVSPSFVPAQGELMRAILARAEGVVLLPGLDASCDDAAWDCIRGAHSAPDHGHAQSGLCHMLEVLRVPRRDVECLAPASPAFAAREVLLREALRPAETTDMWARTKGDRALHAVALRDVALVEAASEHEEAIAVALSLRRALAEGHDRIALVTPDRNLARRVEVELARWKVRVDDSGGRPLRTTPPAVLASLVVDAVAEEFAPVALLELLKHPLAHPQDYEAEARFRSDVRALERIALRGLKPDPGLAGPLARLDRDDAALRGKGREPRTEGPRRALAVVARATEPLVAAFAREAAMPLPEIAALHREACLALAGEALWAQEDGEGLRDLFDGLITDAGGEALHVRPSDYPALFAALAGDRTVRNRRPAHARIGVLGLLEARQLAFDHVVLAGLNEGSWPGQQRNDAWLSRPMRAGIRLPPPEKRLGEAAHDFAQGFASTHVVLTRARRVSGDPTIPARWLQRLDAVAKPELDAARARGRELLRLAAGLDDGPRAPALKRPEPAPPMHMRPRRLSITEIETWIRDPYAIYARHVLGLRPLDPLAELPGPRERGTVIHRAIEAWGVHDPHAPDAAEALRAAMDAELAAFAGHPEVASLWRRQMHAIADWTADWARDRGKGTVPHVEIGGAWDVPGVAGEPFVLTGRPDRIEHLADDTIGIIDFKTGNVPTRPQMTSGLAPQLMLGAAMARGGAFDAALKDRGAKPMAGGTVAHLTYVELKGTRDGNRPIEWRPPAKDGRTPDSLCDETLAGLRDLIRGYDDPARGYASKPRAQFRLAYGHYDHLARVREWDLADDAGDAA